MKIVRMPFNRTVLTSLGGISKSLFSDVLKLMPPDTRLMGFGSDSTQLLDYVFFTSDTFKDIQEGELYPEIFPIFRRTPNGIDYVEKIEFGGTKSATMCIHDFVQYNGLNESYHYCKYCNVRI